MKKLITLALVTVLSLTISIQQCMAQSVNQDLSPLIVAQIGYTVGTVEMIEDHGFDSQAGAFRGIFFFKGKKYVAWYSSQSGVSIGRNLRLTYLDQSDGSWYSLFNPQTQATAYVTGVKPFN